MSFDLDPGRRRAARHYSLARLYPAAKNCLKPLRSTVLDADDAAKVLQLAFSSRAAKPRSATIPLSRSTFAPSSRR